MLPDILEICHFLFCLKICLANETNHRSIHFRIAKICNCEMESSSAKLSRKDRSLIKFLKHYTCSSEEGTSVKAF